MDDKICTIGIGSFSMDNDYTFYESGKIHRLYDRSMAPGNFNLESWLTAKDISDNKKKQILEKCPEKFKERIKGILFE